MQDNDGREIKLGTWLSTQRLQYRRKTLPSDKVDKLQVRV